MLALVEREPAQWQQAIEFTAEIEGEGKPAVVASCLGLLCF